MQYKVVSRWCGWWGGFGPDEAIARCIEQETAGGWRLTSTASAARLWLWCIPRPRVLFVFEREG